MTTIATWNVNSLRRRLPRVKSFLSSYQPDILCVQETKMKDNDFNLIETEFKDLGYQNFHHGNSQWNGVAIFSRIKVQSVQKGFNSKVPNPSIGEKEECRLIRIALKNLIVYNVYVPNGRELDTPYFEEKLRWLRLLEKELDKALVENKNIVVCGDFNVAPDDIDVWDAEALKGRTHVSAKERRALQSILKIGFVDAFRHLNNDAKVFSWWDYRDGSFHKNHGMRIDLALVSKSLVVKMKRVDILRDERKGELPSDHVPVLLQLAVRP
jgi:exodeoxyribonuclease-3